MLFVLSLPVQLFVGRSEIMNLPKIRNGIRLVLTSAAIVVLPVIAVAQSSPQNLNFEAGDAGGIPQGWKVNPGYTAQLTHEQAKEGAYCAELASSSEHGRFGNLMQSFEARAYRGKRIRFRAAVRTEDLGGTSRPNCGCE